MEIKSQNGEYIAPEIDVIYVKSQDVLCASGGLPQYEDGTWTW